MVAEPHGRLWSVEDYLAMERESLVRHEYVDGVVYALAGGTRRHSRIGINACALFQIALATSLCRVFNADMKVQITPRIYRYPDMAVSCDPRDNNADDEELEFIFYPCVVLEVLSSSTARIDRGAKFVEYRTIPTMREYILAAPERMAVQVHRRAENSEWEAMDYGADDTVTLESLGIHFAVKDLYHKVRLSQRNA